LGNFNIRVMLRLAERIFLSPEIKIDEIIKAKFGGESITSDKNRTHRALLRGEYDRFSETENEFVSNLFYGSPTLPSSPSPARSGRPSLPQSASSVVTATALIKS
jgi:hypothetical protein